MMENIIKAKFYREDGNVIIIDGIRGNLEIKIDDDGFYVNQFNSIRCNFAINEGNFVIQIKEE